MNGFGWDQDSHKSPGMSARESETYLSARDGNVFPENCPDDTLGTGWSSHTTHIAVIVIEVERQKRQDGDGA